MAACEVRVPSSLTSPTMCSRSSCTVRPGPSSLATTTEGWVIVSHSSSVPRCMRCSITRIATPERSASRSFKRGLPVAAHASRTSSALNSNAFSAVRWFSRISSATLARNSLSSSIRICASKMRASSTPARSSAFAFNSAMWRLTSFTAARSRRTSFSTCDRGTTRCGTSGSVQRTTTTGPTAIPAETPIPLSSRSLMRPLPGGCPRRRATPP